MTLVISKGITLRKGWQPMDPDAAAYITAVETADTEPLEEKTKIAIDNFVLGCKADGIWSAIKASCILAGARTLTGALVPLVGTAPTNFNFVSGDYDRKTGLVGDGVSKRLTQQNLATPLQDSAHQSIFLSTHPEALTIQVHIGEWPASGTDGRSQITRTGGGVFTRCRETTGATINQTPTGLIGTSRFSSSNYIRRLSGANQTITEASTGIPAQAISILANPVASQFSASRLAFYSIGESLDLALLDARVTDLINAFGAAIP
jgi:hypothetical protein